VQRSVTDHEIAQQVCVTAALALADENREDRDAYRHWVMVAALANERTRLSMLRRGLAMFTFRNRKGGTAQ